jgi:hypothetical protein
MMSRRMLLGSAAIAVTPGKAKRKRAKRMAAWGTELVPGNRAAQIVTAGSGPVLWFNSDEANTVYLGDSSGITAVQQTVTPLPPLSWVAFDGKADVWAICPVGQSVTMYAYPGGMNFFQLAEIIVKTILISASAGNGLFTYSGAPGPGDLIASIVGPGTADDPFGNACLPGFVTYGSADDGSYAQLLQTALILHLGGDFAGGGIALPGSAEIELSSGLATALDSAALLLMQSASASSATGPVVTVATPGAFRSSGGTAANPSLLITDAWHTLGTLAGYGIQQGRYRLTESNEVEIDIDVTAGGANAASVTFATALPAQYRPAVDRHMPLASTRNVTGGDPWPRLSVASATGNVAVLQAANDTASLGTTVRIPLD